MLGTPVASDRQGVVRRLSQAAAWLLRAGPWGARRPWWKWLMIALLLAATVTVTVVYATTLAGDISRQHWANALDASREAVLVIVGWAAVGIVLSAEDDREAEQEVAGEHAPGGQSQDESTPGPDSVLLAQDRVRRLRVRLAELAAARERAGSGADPDLDRELKTTLARLEQARQWLTSAQSAQATHKADQHAGGGLGGASPKASTEPHPARERASAP